MSTKIRPLSNRIVVEAKQTETKTAGGIVLPDSAEKEKPMEGKVIAIGTGKFIDGKLQPPQLKEGDVVLFGKYAGTNIKLAGKELLVMSEDDVMGVLE